MPQTPEDRIRAEFKARKARLDYNANGLPVLFMALAKKWERPVTEIKNIVEYRGRTDWGKGPKRQQMLFR